MGRIIAAGFLLISIIIFIAGFNPCFSYDQVQSIQPRLVKGTITNVDFFGSTVTIKYQQPDGKNDEIVLKLTNHTKVNDGNLRISLSDTNEGDYAVVEYYVDPASLDGPKASQINIK